MRVPSANAGRSGATAVNPVGNALVAGPPSRVIMTSTGKGLFHQGSTFSTESRYVIGRSLTLCPRTLDALSQSLEECRTILKRLYPTRDIQALLPLSRPQLISLLDHPDSFSVPSQASPTGTNTTPLSQSTHSPNGTAQNDDRSLANLEQLPSQDTEWDEDRRNREPIPAEADDVNALSLSVDRQSSYLSATSVKAAFIVMLKVAPGLRSYLAAINSTNNKPFNPGSSYPTPQTASSIRGLQAIPWSSDGQTLIDAYFNRVDRKSVV